jgi:PhoH-like ATPase
LSFVVERFKEEAIAGHITLVKGERSDLAELAATLL